MALDTTALVTGLLGGSAGSALVTGYLSNRAERRKAKQLRTGRARMLHEDFMHFQSTLARTFYADKNGWWEDAWVIEWVTSAEDRQDIFAGLKRREYAAVARGVGWMQYWLRIENAELDPPTAEDIERVYGILAGARQALGRLGDIPYDRHLPDEMKKAEGGRADRRELKVYDKKAAADKAAEAVEQDSPDP